MGNWIILPISHNWDTGGGGTSLGHFKMMTNTQAIQFCIRIPTKWNREVFSTKSISIHSILILNENSKGHIGSRAIFFLGQKQSKTTTKKHNFNMRMHTNWYISFEIAIDSSTPQQIVSNNHYTWIIWLVRACMCVCFLFISVSLTSFRLRLYRYRQSNYFQMITLIEKFVKRICLREWVSVCSFSSQNSVLIFFFALHLIDSESQAPQHTHTHKYLGSK